MKRCVHPADGSAGAIRAGIWDKTERACADDASALQ
jgi:hypothetical protein